MRATELLDEALTETRRLDPGAGDRAFSLVAVLHQFSVFDRTRAWELLSEVVKTANSVPDFTGERGHASLTLAGKFSVRLSVQLASTTDLTESLRLLAEQNFYQALDVSKTLRGDAPRATAMMPLLEPRWLKNRTHYETSLVSPPSFTSITTRAFFFCMNVSKAARSTAAINSVCNPRAPVLRFSLRPTR